MALELPLNFPKYGFTAPNAYIKVGNVNIIESHLAGGRRAQFRAEVYFSQATRQAEKAPLEERTYTMDYDTTGDYANQRNAVCMAYRHLVTLPEYANALNV